MHVARRTCRAARSAASTRFEARDLFLGLRALVIPGRREVRHQAFERRAGPPPPRGRSPRVGSRAQPSHAAVDFQMIGNAHGGADLRASGSRESGDTLRARRALRAENPPSPECARGCRLRAGRCLLRRWRRRASCAPSALQHARNFDGAVTVGVGLHHRHDFRAHRRPAALRRADNFARIAPGFTRNFYPAASLACLSLAPSAVSRRRRSPRPNCSATRTRSIARARHCRAPLRHARARVRMHLGQIRAMNGMPAPPATSAFSGVSRYSVSAPRPIASISAGCVPPTSVA